MKKEEILKAYADELERIGKSENTAKGYLHNISMFLTWLEDTYGKDFDGSVTPRHIREYKSYLETVKKASLSTINTKLAAIQSFCNFLHVVYGNEPIKVEKKKGKVSPKVEILTEKQKHRFLDYMDARANLLHRTIIETIIATGMRESEIVDLELSDIINLDSTKNSYIIVRNGKGGKYREIPVRGDYKKLLREWIEHRPVSDSQKVFIGNRGTLTANGIYKLIHRLGSEIGLNVFPHMLRHQALTDLAKKCDNLQDIKTLQEIAGHSSIETTMRFYVSSSEESKKKLFPDD